MNDTIDEIIVDAEYGDFGVEVAPITAPEQIRDEKTREVVLELTNGEAYSGLSLPNYELPREPILVGDPRWFLRRDLDTFVMKYSERIGNSRLGKKLGIKSRRSAVLKKIQMQRVAAELDAKINWLQESLGIIDSAAENLRTQYNGIVKYKQVRTAIISRAEELLTEYEQQRRDTPLEMKRLAQDTQRDALYAAMATELDNVEAANGIWVMGKVQEQELREKAAYAVRDTIYLSMIADGYKPDIKSAEADLVTLEKAIGKVSQDRLQLGIALDRAKNYAARKVEAAQVLRQLSEINRMTASLNQSIEEAEGIFDSSAAVYLSHDDAKRTLYSSAEDEQVIKSDLAKEKQKLLLKQGGSS